jgi:hypothetical protein
MNLPRYALKAETDLTVFEFISEGPKGSIAKLIVFTETNLKDFYNLAFGDKDAETEKINDKTVSNNGDTDKVLATVVSAIFAFTDKYPEAWVYATGSTASRTRLYRMGINKYFKDIEQELHIFCEFGDDWLPFESERDFDGYAVKRKNY